MAALPGYNSPAVLHYEGAPLPSADPKLGKPNLDLGCKYQLDTDGIVDFKETMLPPHKSEPKVPANATQAHVIWLTNNGVPDMGQAQVVGNQSIYGLAPKVRGNSRHPHMPSCHHSAAQWW